MSPEGLQFTTHLKSCDSDLSLIPEAAVVFISDWSIVKIENLNTSVLGFLAQDEDFSGTPVKVQKTESAAELEMS